MASKRFWWTVVSVLDTVAAVATSWITAKKIIDNSDNCDCFEFGITAFITMLMALLLWVKACEARDEPCECWCSMWSKPKPRAVPASIAAQQMVQQGVDDKEQAEDISDVDEEQRTADDAVAVVAGYAEPFGITVRQYDSVPSSEGSVPKRSFT